MTGVGAGRRLLREKVLRRHHLMSAFRMPSEIFPGANLVTDLLFFPRPRRRSWPRSTRATASSLTATTSTSSPSTSSARKRAEDTRTTMLPTAHRAATVTRSSASFEGLPVFAERTLCSACIVRPTAFAPATASRLVRRVDTGDLTLLLAAAVSLGSRVADYLAERANGNTRAVELWPELLQSLRDFQRAPEVIEIGAQNPWLWMDLRRLAEQENPGAQSFLNAFSKAGEIAAPITQRPEVEERFAGEPSDLLGQAEYLYRSRRRLTVDELLDFHQDQGGTLSRADALARLFRADWCVDGGGLRELVPPATTSPATSGRSSIASTSRTTIGAPRGSPMTSSSGNETVSSRRSPRSSSRTSTRSPRRRLHPAGAGRRLDLGDDQRALRRDRPGAPGRPRPGRGRRLRRPEEGAARPRSALADRLAQPRQHLLRPRTASITTTPRPTASRPSRACAISRSGTTARATSAPGRRTSPPGCARTLAAWRPSATPYNRAFRRFVRREYSGSRSTSPAGAARSASRTHQNAAIRRVLEARGGLIAFDVGVGKTYTGLGILARARQEGWGDGRSSSCR